MSDETGLRNDLRRLIDGVVVVFDDESRTEGSDAKTLIDELRSLGFPVVDYIEPPARNKQLMRNIHGASCVVFDWNFSGEAKSLVDDDGNPIGRLGQSDREAYAESERIDSLKLILKNTYCPVFFVTQEAIEPIALKLDGAGICKNGTHPRILFCNKMDLRTNAKQFWNKIAEWLSQAQPIYTLKTLEQAARMARQETFIALERHPDWPMVLWGAYKNDGEDASVALSEFICRQITQRTIYKCVFSKRMMMSSSATGEGVEEILAADRYMEIPATSREPFVAGDVFEINCRWFVNVRATCDTIRCDPAELYLLPCYDILALPEDYDINAHEVHDQGGQLVRWDKSFIIPCSISGKTVEVDFSRLNVQKISVDERKRIGRILPPFLTRLQQLFGAYVIREGLPVTPEPLRQRVLNELKMRT